MTQPIGESSMMNATHSALGAGGATSRRYLRVRPVQELEEELQLLQELEREVRVKIEEVGMHSWLWEEYHWLLTQISRKLYPRGY